MDTRGKNLQPILKRGISVEVQNKAQFLLSFRENEKKILFVFSGIGQDNKYIFIWQSIFTF
jgi:hypothetical protein